jgi:hypothetical protein
MNARMRGERSSPCRAAITVLLLSGMSAISASTSVPAWTSQETAVAGRMLTAPCCRTASFMSATLRDSISGATTAPVLAAHR